MATRGHAGPRLPRHILDQIGNFPSSQGYGYRQKQNFFNQKGRDVRGSNIQRQRTEQDEFDGFSDVSDSPLSEARSAGDVMPSKSTQPPRKRRRPSTEVLEQPQRVPSRVAEKLAEDDDEISRLQKKLGIKSNKLPKSFDDEGLGGLLGDLDYVDNPRQGRGSSKRNVEDEMWLQKKRLRQQATPSEAPFKGDSLASGESEAFSSDEDMPSSGGIDTARGEDINNSEDISHSSISTDVPSPPRKRENPFVPPIISKQAKYVPPSRRAAPTSDDEVKAQLRRQVQGSLNKLSGSNIMSIVSEIEKLYASHPRQYVHSTIIDLVINLVGDVAALNTTFLVLHAAFLAAFYRIIGADFGAQCLERIVQRISENTQTNQQEQEDGKRVLNLISILSHLYNFAVVSSNLIFEYIREFLDSINEAHTELLLRVVRSCGHQLRQDDPGAIKDIAMMLQKRLSSYSESMSVKMRFMIDEIAKLRDNKSRQASGTGDIAELVTRFRKALGTLSSRNVKANQPMSIGLRDIRNGEKKGKWWLIGASWSGNANANGTTSTRDTRSSAIDDSASDSGSLGGNELDFTAVAKQHQMNTDIRRAIFVTIMSSSDYSDAHTRLLKLNLTRSQELQIPHVLLHCVATESRYNPYYMLISRKLCNNHKLRMSFHFALWDFLKRVESDEDEVADEAKAEPVSMTALANYAKFYGDLVVSQVLPIVVLKISLPRTPSRLRTFIELFLLTVIAKVKSTASLEQIFAKAVEVDGLSHDLKWLVTKILPRSDLFQSEPERKKAVKKCAYIKDILEEAKG